MSKKVLKIFIIGSFIAYVLLMFCISISTYWPENFWWLANVITIGPTWVFLLPLFLILPVIRLLRGKEVLVWFVVITFIFAYRISGFVVNYEFESKNRFRSINELKLLTVNLGNGGQKMRLIKLIRNIEPDIVALQETSKSYVNDVANAVSWNYSCSGELCLITPYSVKLIKSKSRRFINHYGNFIAHFVVRSPVKVINFFVLHLQTVRDGLEDIIHNPTWKMSSMKKVTKEQILESMIASNWVHNQTNTIVAGDFNLSVRNPIYKKYWYWLQNSFVESGLGLGYSWHSSWHGVRIDHILFDGEHWKVKKSWIGPALGGDHLPVISTLEYK